MFDVVALVRYRRPRAPVTHERDRVNLITRDYRPGYSRRGYDYVRLEDAE